MLRIRSLTLVTLALLALAACGKKDKESAPAKDDVVATPPPAPTPPPPPPPAVYSPDAAKQLIAKLDDCVVPDSCEPYKTLVGFGPQVGPDLLAAIADPAVPAGARAMAATTLGALKLPDAGPKLVELGSTIDDHSIQRDVFKAAGASGGQATFDALIAAYDKAIADLDDDRDIPLRGGLRAFPAESIAWAAGKLAAFKGKTSSDATGYADLFTDSATAADLPVLVTSLGKTKDPMVRHRLAAKAIELGDLAHFEVFAAGLQSDDQYDRSDAANFLARVADKVPADQKAKLVELLEKAKAGDQGGLTSRGYDEALKNLKQ